MIVKVNIPQELGYGLVPYMLSFGWALYQNENGIFVCENNAPQPEQPVSYDEEGLVIPAPMLELPEVQALVDSYNPWGYEKTEKLKEINTWFSTQVSNLTAGITQEEKDSWPVQVNEAYGVRPLAMLPAMAAGRGITVEMLIQKIKAKAEAFSLYYGAIQGERDRVEDLIKAMPDTGEYHRLPELWGLTCSV